MSAIVLEDSKVVCCAITQNGCSRLIKIPMTEAEWIAYKNNPECFIAQRQGATKIADGDYLSFYDWIYSTYKNSSKEKLMEFLKLSPEDSDKYMQKDLAKEFSLRNTYSLIAMTNKESVVH
jgi:hypothetical protein